MIKNVVNFLFEIGDLQFTPIPWGCNENEKKYQYCDECCRSKI